MEPASVFQPFHTNFGFVLLLSFSDVKKHHDLKYYSYFQYLAHIITPFFLTFLAEEKLLM